MAANTAGEMGLLYKVDEKPRNLRDALVLGFQHPLTMFGPMTITPMVVSAAVGMSPKQTALLISLAMISAGVGTIFQTTFGSKLPVIQTMSLAFIAAYLAIAKQVTAENGGVADIGLIMRYVGGAVILGGIVELTIGVSGMLKLLGKVITPVIMGPVIVLIMLSMAETTVQWAGENWLITLLAATLVITMSNILPNTEWGRKRPYIKATSVLVPILATYILSWILSAAGVISPESGAYVDISIIKDAPWFVVPGGAVNWGAPIFRLDFFLLVLTGYIMSMIESIGQYHANTIACRCGRISDKRIGMGIGMEGLGCVLSGLIGGLASTSAGENIGLVETTGVASRHIARIGGVMLIVFGLCGKSGAFVSSLTEPIMAGVFVSILGIVGGCGIQTFAQAHLNTRNVSIFGIALIFGMGMPSWIAANPIAVGNITWLTNTVNGLLSSSMAVGGIVAILLDQILPGTDEERGVLTEAVAAEA